MKTNYRGYEIDCSRDESCGAGEHLYFSVFRIEDQLCVVESFTTGEDSESAYVRYMKERVDEFIRTKGASEDMADDYTLPDNTEMTEQNPTEAP